MQKWIWTLLLACVQVAFGADGPTQYPLRGHATDDAFRTVITSTIKDGAVTASKLASGAVTAGAVGSGVALTGSPNTFTQAQTMQSTLTVTGVGTFINGLTLGSDADNNGKLYMYATGDKYVGFQLPALGVTNDQTYTLPSDYPGSNGYALTSTTGGTLSWAAMSSGLTVGTTSIASGTSGRVLYNAAGTLGELTTTGTGSVVRNDSPTLITPTLGVASATTVNKVAFTAPASSATLTIADGKTLTASNTLTFTGTDASSVAFGTGGTVLYSGGALGTPASGTLSNATGLPLSTGVTGTLPFANGGFGFTTATAGDLFYASATDTPGKLGIGTGGYKLRLVGGLPAWNRSVSYSAKSSAYTVASTDDANVVDVTTGASNVTISLTAAATAGNGFSVAIRKADSGAGYVVIDPDGSETVSVDGTGLTTLNLGRQGMFAYLVSDGSGWLLMSPYNPEVRAYHSTTQSYSNDTFLANHQPLDSERSDDDNMHFTSAANLTGTVAKTNGSATLTGTGTSFTTELSVGQVIAVPGTSTEMRVVTAIASNTSLTVSGNFLATASGQTANRVNSALVARVPGTYAIFGHLQWTANNTGIRLATIELNSTKTGATYIWVGEQGGSSVSSARMHRGTLWKMAQWDFVQMADKQTSGGSLSTESGASYTTEFRMVRVGP